MLYPLDAYSARADGCLGLVVGGQTYEFRSKKTNRSISMLHTIQLISRYSVGIILLVGSISKLANMEWFIGVLRRYNLAPRDSDVVMALAIAIAELALGLFLIAGEWLPWSVYIALFLFLIFTVAITINLIRGRFIECGCGGFWKRGTIGWQLVLRNLGLSGLALLSNKGGLWLVSHAAWIFALSVTFVALPLLPKRQFHR